MTRVSLVIGKVADMIACYVRMLITVDKNLKAGLNGFVDEVRTGLTSKRSNANPRRQGEKPIFYGVKSLKWRG
jgi:hypothetical protein